jgi:beta-1,4-mannooligosaccharide phosphorylase
MVGRTGFFGLDVRITKCVASSMSLIILLRSLRSLRLVAFLFALLIFLSLVSARAELGGFNLCSPRDGDHFEVSRPMLFWQASAGASHYEIFVDDKPIAEIKAAAVPVMSYAVQAPLPDGTHRWFLKATGSGGEIESRHFVFTVEPSKQWPSWAIGPFIKYGGNPILRPEGAGWEGWNAYNPGVLFDDGWFRMLYRGQERISVGSGQRTLSRIGYAESLDGVTFLRNSVPVIDATEQFESRYGCEDARLVKYHGVYYAFYTGNLNVHSSKICLCEATSTDCIHWKKLGIIETGTKNGAIVRDPVGRPVRINDRFVMYTGDSSLGVCYSDDLIHWGAHYVDGSQIPGGMGCAV